MTSEEQILREVTASFEAGVGGKIGNKLNRSGQAAFNQAFRLTIARFAKRAAKRKYDVWRVRRFHDFILFAAKKIGQEANARAKGGVVNRDAFQNGAVYAMLHVKKHGKCKLRQEGNKLVDVPRVPAPGHGDGSGIMVQAQGEVCTGYLADQLRA